MESQDLNLSHESKVATEVFRTVDPLNFYSNFLKEGIRPDGRKLTSYRKYNVKDLLNNKLYIDDTKNNQQNEHTFHMDNDNNSLLYQKQHLYKHKLTNVLISSIYLTSGNSMYHCKITGDLTTTDKTLKSFYGLPSTFESPDDVFSVDVNLPKHVLTEVYDINGPCINITHMVSTLIQTVLNSSEVVPKDQFNYDVLYSKLPEQLQEEKILSYFKGYKLRWKLKFEITCDEYDGNLLDYCFLCCTNAVNHSKIPYVVIVQESNNQYPCLLTKSLMELDGLVELNKSLLLLQLEQNHTNDTFESYYHYSTNDLYNYSLNNNLSKNVLMQYLPYTLTFCKCLNYFLVDPSMEDERVGVNYSIYVLKKNKSKIDNNNFERGLDIDNDDNNNYTNKDVSLQPLNLYGMSDLPEDILNQLYRVSLALLKYM